MFEEEYDKAIRSSKFVSLFEGVDLETAADGVHNGYFAIDKQKDSTGTDRFKESKGDGKTAADESAYKLIMQDKERLLLFESKLKFIFSHSALREGWDNPNVFQICTLNETASVMKKRQEIGRGLRIAVNQNGERVRDGVNVLTVIANESYREFARRLQRKSRKTRIFALDWSKAHVCGNRHTGRRRQSDASWRRWFYGPHRIPQRQKLCRHEGQVTTPQAL